MPHHALKLAAGLALVGGVAYGVKRVRAPKPLPAPPAIIVKPSGPGLPPPQSFVNPGTDYVGPANATTAAQAVGIVTNDNSGDTAASVGQDAVTAAAALGLG